MPLKRKGVINCERIQKKNIECTRSTGIKEKNRND